MTVEMCPYVYPRGSAREALAAYRRALGGDEPALATYGDVGVDDPAVRDLVANAALRPPLSGLLMVSDAPPGQEPPSAGSVCLTGDDETALQAAWDVLVEGGDVLQPLEPSPWGSRFGSCRDRWGVSWVVDITGAG